MKSITRIICLLIVMVMFAVSYIPATAIEKTDFFISEVCYNPMNKDGSDLYEYIELINISDKAIDITGGTVTRQNDGGSIKTNNLYTAGSGVVQPGQIVIVMIYQAINAACNFGYANKAEMDALRADFNKTYNVNISAEAFFVAPRVTSGEGVDIEEAFNLSNSAEEVILKFFDKDGKELCIATYNAAKYSKGETSVGFGISPTQGVRCMGMAANTPGEMYKELYTEDTTDFTEDIKVMTYNIATTGTPGDIITEDPDVGDKVPHESLFISERYDEVIGEITRESPDIVCLQEVNYVWREYIKALLCDKYAYSGVSCVTKRTLDEINDKWDWIPLILYDKAKYEMVDEGVLWGPPDPVGVCSPNNWVELKDKSTGARFVVMNQHLSAKYPDNRLASALMVIESLKEVAKDLPFLLLGDYNSGEDSEIYRAFKNFGLTDTLKMNPDNTFRGTNSGNRTAIDPETGEMYLSRDMNTTFPIDNVMVSNGDFSVKSHRVLEGFLESGYPYSDHYPVVVELSMKKVVPEYDWFDIIEGSAHRIDGAYLFAGCEGLSSKDFLRSAFDSPLCYETSVTSTVAAVGTDDKVMLKSDNDSFVTVVMKGDITGDGKIKSADYSRIKNAFRGSVSLSDAKFMAADINGDGRVTSADYIKVKKHIAGNYNVFKGMPV